jgi:hypothetical protein
MLSWQQDGHALLAAGKRQDQVGQLLSAPSMQSQEHAQGSRLQLARIGLQAKAFSLCELDGQ